MRHVIIATSLLLAASACTQMQTQTAAPASTPTVVAVDTSGNGNCKAQASSRLSLFDRPDTYPISAAEKQNAYQALYNECMKNNDASGPKPNFQIADNSAANFANLSPAAGGNAYAAKPVVARGGVITYPNGTTVIDPTQFANLSPAAGGMPGVTSATSANGSTVVVVQAASATPVYPAQPVVQQAAIPVARTAAMPVKTMAEPKTQTAQYQPGASTDAAPKPKRVAYKAPTSTTATAQKDPNDKRSRFEKNAIPVALSIKGPSNADLTALSPSAGSVLDSAVSTNPLPAKD